VFSILFIASQAFGFIHAYEFGFAGYFDINALLAILYIGSILASLHRLGDFKKSEFLFVYVAIILIGIYGILLPYFNNFSSLFYAFKEAKEYFNYLAYFSVFLFVREQKEIDWCWRFIWCFAIYFSVLQILGNMTGGLIFNYLEYKFRPEQVVFVKVYLPIFPIIILSFFMVFYHLAFGDKKHREIFLFFLYSLGILFTFFRAYILSASATIPALLFLKKRIKAGIISILILFALLVTSILFISATSGGRSFTALFESFITSGITELYHYRGGSLRGRDKVTEGRMDLVRERPLSGWGFLDRDSKVGKRIRRKVGLTAYGEIGFIDKGYLDVVAKFGILVTLVFYGTFLLILLKLILMYKEAYNFDFKAKLFSATGLTIVLLCVQLTHASLTRQFGILPLSIVLALVDREYILNKESARVNPDAQERQKY
jgi:hypothetical protein